MKQKTHHLRSILPIALAAAAMVSGLLLVEISTAPAPVMKAPTQGKAACRPTGCSGQLCADQDVVSTCEYREEYGCYVSATCERQTSGECGWTRSPQLTTCLEQATTPIIQE